MLADCIYERTHFNDLLDTIEWLSTPSTEILVSFEVRNKGEAEFLKMAKRRFRLLPVPASDLDPEYQAEEIVVLRMFLLPPDMRPTDEA